MALHASCIYHGKYSFLCCFLLVLTIGSSQSLSDNDAFFNETDAEINKTYIENVSNSTFLSYKYKYDFLPTQTWTIRLSVASYTANNTYPVFFVVRHQRGVLSWQIPMVLDNRRNKYFYQMVNRTLCPLQNYPSPQTSAKEQVFFVDVSTQSPNPLAFVIRADEIKDFVISTGVTRTLTITPSQPQYVEYRFPENTSIVLIHITSENEFCTLVSIQSIQCPVVDITTKGENSGFFQTMSRQAGITVTRDDFPEGRFYIVLTLEPIDYDCAGIEAIRPAAQNYTRTKSLDITVSPKITRNEYYEATFGALGFFLLFYILSIVVSAVYFIKEVRNPTERSLLESPQDAERPFINSLDESSSYGTFSTNRGYYRPSTLKNVSSGVPEFEDSAAIFAPTGGIDEDDSSFEGDVDMLHDADEEKDVFRTKTFLYVADLARKRQKKLSKKSSLYVRNLLTIAVFYGIPVVQLVYTYQLAVHVTGNQDDCYYNFLCAHPLGFFTDFNHVFSNLGYVLLGLLFLGLVWRRDLIHQKAAAFNPRLEKYFGIPKHFGLFYAMGVSLMMEGVLSACYHVCPNSSNFQFDTAFMYIIAGLNMLKIYQSRHPDVNANSHSAYMTFAIIILIGVAGVLNGSELFWICFGALHVLSCFLLSIQVYYMGRWKLNCGIFKRVYLTLRNDLSTHFTRPMYPDRLFLLILANFVNWGLLAYGLSSRPKDFCSFLLTIFISNLLLYITFYIIMKLRYREKILAQPSLYIFLSVLFWCAALYFFLQKNVSWKQTPAQSRAKNHECVILHFYDVHDIWHFLSSAALFFSFMVLLTLDDDLLYIPRDKIPVF